MEAARHDANSNGDVQRLALPGRGAPHAARGQAGLAPQPGAWLRHARSQHGVCRRRCAVNRPLLSDYHTRVRGFATYDIALTAERSARRWMKTAKRSGRATVTGGGWWKIEGWYQRVQGYA